MTGRDDRRTLDSVPRDLVFPYGTTVELPSRPPGLAVPWLVLGQLLRHRRESRAITRPMVAAATRLAETTIRELEHGRARISIPHLLQLCRAYGISDRADRITLLTLATVDEGPAWWEPYRDVLDDWMDGYLAAEQSAELIRHYEPQFIPGLLQTPAYTRAVVNLELQSASEREVERRVELRARRQEILGPGSGTRVWAVLDESSLMRSIGGPAVMFEQIEHLIDLCEHPRVTIQVLPLRAASAAAARGPIVLLRLPQEQLGDIVYLEHQADAIFISDPAEVHRYQFLLDRLAVYADEPSTGPERLRQLLSQVSRY